MALSACVPPVLAAPGALSSRGRAQTPMQAWARTCLPAAPALMRRAHPIAPPLRWPGWSAEPDGRDVPSGFVFSSTKLCLALHSEMAMHQLRVCRERGRSVFEHDLAFDQD